jgi:hypothetical protein
MGLPSKRSSADTNSADADRSLSFDYAARAIGPPLITWNNGGHEMGALHPVKAHNTPARHMDSMDGHSGLGK